MANVTVTYREQEIATLDNAGTKTLKTEGKRCDSDIVVSYVVRCPRADVVTAFDLDDLFTQFQPTATAAEEE